MKRIVVFGTFDGLHSGHIYFLKQARALGGKLIVVVAPDSVVKQLKNKNPRMNEHERLNLVSALKIVDVVVVGDQQISSYKIVKKLKPDIICVGYDQKALGADLRKHFPDLAIATAKSYKRRRMHTTRLTHN